MNDPVIDPRLIEAMLTGEPYDEDDRGMQMLAGLIVFVALVVAGAVLWWWLG